MYAYVSHVVLVLYPQNVVYTTVFKLIGSATCRKLRSDHRSDQFNCDRRSAIKIDLIAIYRRSEKMAINKPAIDCRTKVTQIQ